MAGGHFGQRFYRVEDASGEAGCAYWVSICECHNVCDFSDVAFCGYGYLDTITHMQTLDCS